MNAPDSKSGIRVSRIEGSNPSSSAKQKALGLDERPKAFFFAESLKKSGFYGRYHGVLASAETLADRNPSLIPRLFLQPYVSQYGFVGECSMMRCIDMCWLAVFDPKRTSVAPAPLQAGCPAGQVLACSSRKGFAVFVGRSAVSAMTLRVLVFSPTPAPYIYCTAPLWYGLS